MKRASKKRARIAVALGICAMSILLANLWVYGRARAYVRALDDVPVAEAIVVPGAALHGGRPSPVLEARLFVAERLFADGRAPRILVSGRREPYYDEPGAMARLLVEEGVPRERILEDPLGVRTVETFRRARDAFELERVIVVTNAFHLHRALFLARRLGIDAVGVPADDARFAPSARLKWHAREALARARALFDVGP